MVDPEKNEAQAQETKISSVEDLHDSSEIYKQQLEKANEELKKATQMNKELYDMVMENSKPSTENKDNRAPEDLEKEIRELRKSILDGKDKTNLDFCSKAIKLRDLVMKAGGTDIFLPVGHDVITTNYDREQAQVVADVITECIKVADGDSDIFTRELNRKLVDPVISKRR